MRAPASVILCCHDSRDRLPATLDHLAMQRTAAPWEVVLVDNACSDGTAGFARARWRELGEPAPLRIVEEPRRGLSHARAKGLSHARHGIAVFCDDDNWLAPDYLAEAARVMHEYPQAGAAGGWSDAASDSPLPAWFDACCAEYAVGPQAAASGDVTARGFLWGAGLVVRVDAWRGIHAAGVKPLLADRSGRSLASGGDAELCMWLVMAGYTLRYDEALRFTHFMPANRLTRQYHGELLEGFRDAGLVLDRYRKVLHARAGPHGWREFAAALARTIAGREGRAGLQAVNPLPSWVIDRTTWRVQQIAGAIGGPAAKA